MHLSSWLALALASSSCTLAAPTYSGWTAPSGPQSRDIISSYLNALALRVGALRASVTVSSAPVCDLSTAVMPTAPTPLPPPSPGLTLKHVAIGRGTQNYTCAPGASVPVAVGALATLYNASCIAATAPTVLSTLPAFSLEYNLASPPSLSAAPVPNLAHLDATGIHYFSTLTTPFFDLSTPLHIGTAPCAKNASSPAPAEADKGQGGKGDGAVPWLKLLTKDGATGGLAEVYRLNTAGGSAPATCDGLSGMFEVQYAAEYWFYAK